MNPFRKRDADELAADRAAIRAMLQRYKRVATFVLLLALGAALYGLGYAYGAMAYLHACHALGGHLTG